MPTRCAIIGSGNIGTDLMMKILRSDRLELAAPIGIDPASDGLARARSLGVEATPNGISWVSEHRDEVDLVLDATSAYVHVRHATVLADLGMPVIDLTPAARGPKVIPTVNLAEHLDAPNVNMVTCGGQATTPIVAAVSQAADVPYAEMVSTVASVSAGPGTRQNIDEFTRTTARALEEIGGAALGKAKDLGLEAVGFLMMAHMISPEELLAQAGKMQDYGADLVYCVDSAGAMTTPMARDRDRGAGRRAGDPGRHPRPRKPVPLGGQLPRRAGGGRAARGRVHGRGGRRGG